jgi:predicted metalloprotease with PDZ domain
LLAEHGLPKPGFAEDGGFRGAVEKVAAAGAATGDFGDFFARHVSGLDELPYDAMLTRAGLKLEITRAPAARSIGVTTRTDADRLIVDSVPPTGAGYDAGLMPGDALLALDEERVMPATFAARLNDRRAGAAVKLQVMRGDRLLSLPVTLQDDQKPTYKIVEDPAASPAARALRDAWLRP